jgi:hypothetical protein
VSRFGDDDVYCRECDERVTPSNPHDADCVIGVLVAALGQKDFSTRIYKENRRD